MRKKIDFTICGTPLPPSPWNTVLDMKKMPAIIGHISSRTTLNIYSHITDEMQENAAVASAEGIAKAELKNRQEELTERKPFIPYQPERRRPGTGYLKQIEDDLWEGRYSPVWPDGKEHPECLRPHQEWRRGLVSPMKNGR